jgi:hypothetical protein
MAVAKLVYGSRTALTTTALNSLASATYVSAGTITFLASAKVPLTSKLEVNVTPGTVSSNKQVLVFARASVDNTDFTTGPTSGTTTTDEPNLIFVGAIPCNTNSTLQRGQFDLAQVFGGALPPYVQIVVKNETGAALAASGHAVYYTNADGDIT